MSNYFSWGFRSISGKTLSAENPGFTPDHSGVDNFQLKHADLVKAAQQSLTARFGRHQTLDIDVLES